MGYRRTYLRRLRAAKRLEKRLAVVALLGMVACAAAVLLLREPAPETPDRYPQAGAAPMPQALRLAAYAPAARAGARRVYPFSVVPGGVAGREELVHVLQTDKVVAVHYAGFQVARASAVTVSKPRAVYVSYRKGDKVYWTSKRVMLVKGETLLSDGSHEIRTRCGNRISDVPQMPVADNEPSAQMLDTALSMDADTDDADDQRQADASADAPGDAANAASAAGQAWRPAVFASGPTLAPRSATALALLGMSGMGSGAAPLVQPEKLTPVPRIVIAAQTGVVADSGTSSGTPGASSDGTGGTGGTSGSTPDTGTTTGSGTGTSSTITPVLGTDGPPTVADTKADTPPPPDPLSPSGAPPVVVGKTAAGTNDVPEPGSLWLGAAALAAMRLVRRTPRRALRGG